VSGSGFVINPPLTPEDVAYPPLEGQLDARAVAKRHADAMHAQVEANSKLRFEHYLAALASNPLFFDPTTDPRALVDAAEKLGRIACEELGCHGFVDSAGIAWCFRCRRGRTHDDR